MKKLLITTVITTVFAFPIFAIMPDDPLLAKVTVDRLEQQFNDDATSSWEGNIWVGYDLNKIYLYSEGDKPKNGAVESEHELVFSHAIAPYWDIQLGIGYDKSEDNDFSWGVIAFSGLAPYFFETRAAILVGDNESFGFRFEAEYEALFTQGLILTPSFSTAVYSKDIPEVELGEGLSNITFGLRLRYEFTREFAPYIGYEWSKNFGNTNDLKELDEFYATAGLRFWF